MRIISRKQAIAAGTHKYFTGKPCKNGHIAERYTTSGTCEACIRGAVADERAGLTYADAREVVSAAKAELGVFNIRCYPGDIETIKGTALALAQVRYPGLSLSDVLVTPNGVQPAGGTLMFRFRVHGADIDLLRGVEQALLKAHGVNAAAERARIHRQILEQADAETPKLPDWKP